MSKNRILATKVKIPGTRKGVFFLDLLPKAHGLVGTYTEKIHIFLEFFNQYHTPWQYLVRKLSQELWKYPITVTLICSLIMKFFPVLVFILLIFRNGNNCIIFDSRRKFIKTFLVLNFEDYLISVLFCFRILLFWSVLKILLVR